MPINVENINRKIKDINTQMINLTSNGAITKRVVCTQVEYDALVTAGTVDANTEYLIVG